MTDESGHASKRTAPARREIASIREAMSFRIARMAAINERMGTHHFKSQYDLSLAEWRILGLTAAMQPLAFSELRDILLVDKGLLSRTLKSLVSRELITTQSLKSDARQIELNLTAKGRSLHDQVLQFTVERNASMTRVLTDEEWHAFDKTLNKLLEFNQKLVNRRSKDNVRD